MNYSNKLCLCLVTLISFSCFGMMRQLIRDENGFRLSDGKQEQVVQSHFVDPLLKRMSPEQLKTFVEQGNRIRAIRLSNGEHRLQAMVTGLGGGPLLTSLAVTGILVGGGVASLAAAAGGFVIGGPAGAIAAGAITAKATCAAAVYVAIVTTVAPTP